MPKAEGVNLSEGSIRSVGAKASCYGQAGVGEHGMEIEAIQELGKSCYFSAI